MALRIRFLGPTGSTLGFSIERLSDGSIYDFSTSQFTSGTPTTPLQSLPENIPSFPGQYKATLSTTPVAQFTNGDYAITVVDELANLCVGVLQAVMSNGDDTTVIPGGPVASVVAPVTVGTNNDKSGYALSQVFPGNFASLTIDGTGRVTAGSVADKSGYALSQAFPTNFANLAIDSATGGITVKGYASGQDPASLVLATPANKLATDGTGRVTAGSVADKSGYALSQAFPGNFASLAIDGTGRVTAGSVADKSGYSLSQAFPSNFASLTIDGTGRVAAGSVADKSGYALATSGLDAIQVEAGINVRQALAPILAAAAGVLTGAGSGTIVIQGANGNASRIVATTDNAGNRLSVVLALPN